MNKLNILLVLLKSSFLVFRCFMICCVCVTGLSWSRCRTQRVLPLRHAKRKKNAPFCNFFTLLTAFYHPLPLYHFPFNFFYTFTVDLTSKWQVELIIIIIWGLFFVFLIFFEFFLFKFFLVFILNYFL